MLQSYNDKILALYQKACDNASPIKVCSKFQSSLLFTFGGLLISAHILITFVQESAKNEDIFAILHISMYVLYIVYFIIMHLLVQRETKKANNSFLKLSTNKEVLYCNSYINLKYLLFSSYLTKTSKNDIIRFMKLSKHYYNHSSTIKEERTKYIYLFIPLSFAIALNMSVTSFKNDFSSLFIAGVFLFLGLGFVFFSLYPQRDSRHELHTFLENYCIVKNWKFD